MKSPVYKILIGPTVLVILLLLAGRVSAAGMQSFRMTDSLPPVHMTCTQVNQRNGAVSRQAFILNLRPNTIATLRLRGTRPVDVQISGRLHGGGVQLEYSVVDRGQTYGPARLMVSPDVDPVDNMYYMDDVALQLQFAPASAAHAPVAFSQGTPPTPMPSWVSCHTCHGTGACQACGGQGHVACTTCDSTGLCSHCKGSTACASCAGTGLVFGHKCQICGGTGACPYCNTPGTATVAGDGKCPDCQGKGYSSICALCNGTGQCHTCKGKGKSRI